MLQITFFASLSSLKGHFRFFSKTLIADEMF